jgi:hypothetical protein
VLNSTLEYHNITALPLTQLTMTDDIEAELMAAGKELDKVGLSSPSNYLTLTEYQDEEIERKLSGRAHHYVQASC